MEKALTYVNGAIALIQQDAATFKDAAQHLVSLAGNVGDKNVLGVLADFQAEATDWQKITGDLKSIFGL